MCRAALVWKVALGIDLRMGWLLCTRKAGRTAEVRVRCAGAARAWRMRVGRREAAMASMGWWSGEGRGVVVVVVVVLYCSARRRGDSRTKADGRRQPRSIYGHMFEYAPWTRLLDDFI